MPGKAKVPALIFPVSGRALWQALGFANERAFQRARRANRLDLPLYPVPGKARGVYARSDDLARYLAQLTPTPLERSAAP